jgi:hypothetical protein
LRMRNSNYPALLVGALLVAIVIFTVLALRIA